MSTEEMWLGGTDAQVEGSWTWSDGSPWSYSAWQVTPDGVSQPDNFAAGQHCATTNFLKQGAWDDEFCEASADFIKVFSHVFVCKQWSMTGSPTMSVGSPGASLFTPLPFFDFISTLIMFFMFSSPQPLLTLAKWTHTECVPNKP
eukprot:9158120-Pyramimonas_sp.AAC.1